MKIAVIGGASSYTPELADGFFSDECHLDVDELCLMDPREDRLNIVADFVQRMARKRGRDLAIRRTTALDEALHGARYVIAQIRVGGGMARVRDEKLGRRHGVLGQETTGVGGFACALRTIPAILDLARAMEERAPDATLINFTNPAGIVTEAVLRHSTIRVVGLCNIPIGIQREVAGLHKCDLDAVDLRYVGLNHLSWIDGFRVDGRDLTREVLAHLIDHAHEEWPAPSIAQGMQDAMRALGAWCNPYLQYFYCTEASLDEQRITARTRGEEVLDIERELFETYADASADEKPAALSKRGGALYSTAALRVIQAMEADAGATHIVCCANRGAIPGLDDDAAVEVPAKLFRRGAEALAQAVPPQSIWPLMKEIKTFESLAVQAAVSGDYAAALAAVERHPLMPTGDEARALLDDLLDSNAEHLSKRFHRTPCGSAT